MRGILAALVGLVVMVGAIVGAGVTADESEAATTAEVTITRTPSYCEFGRWIEGNSTYVGARCSAWEDVLFSDKLKTVIEISNHGGFISQQQDEHNWSKTSGPVVTPTPTPTSNTHWLRDCMVYSQSCNDCLWHCSTWGYRSLDTTTPPVGFTPCPICPSPTPKFWAIPNESIEGNFTLKEMPNPTPTPNWWGTLLPPKWYYGDTCPFPTQTFQDEQCTSNLYVYDYFGYKVFLTQGSCGSSMQVLKKAGVESLKDYLDKNPSK